MPIRLLPVRTLALLALAPGLTSVLFVGRLQAAPDWSLAGDWEIVIADPDKATLSVPPPTPRVVTAQKFDSVPPYQNSGGGWKKGVRLPPLVAQETTTPHLLEPESFELRSGPEPASTLFVRGRDYELEPVWGTFGRLPGGAIGENQPVYASYRHAWLRLDTVIRTAEGRIEYRAGTAAAAAPLAPEPAPGEVRLGHVWIPGAIPRLTPDHLFPVLEESFPEAPATPRIAETLLPKTLARLRSGEPLRILAWGDSVTDAGYLPGRPATRWQDQFVARLQERFPAARIELVTEAWGGRNTGSYLGEPPGSEHNYEEKVLGARPDLVVSEFVNDAGLRPDQVAERYGKLLADFRRIGAEWIILTPHYTRPDWMGLDREREIDEDPRPYVRGIREFSAANGVALADASRRYGRLWRQGLPYSALMLNSINHPDARGMKIFADALMELFP